MVDKTENDNAETRLRHVVVDSRDRDYIAYPSANRYEVYLDDEIRDVVSMRLVLADVPFCAFMIGKSNCNIPLSVTGNATVVAALPYGDYATPLDMASELASSMNAVSAGAFSIDYVPRTDSFDVRSVVPFELRFLGATATAARVLGFSPSANYASELDAAVGQYVVHAPFRRDFTLCRYIIMNVSPSAEVLSSTNNATNRSFAVLPSRDHRELSIDSGGAWFVKKWDPPLARFSRIGLEFTGYDGSPYDFQNQEHHVELQFRSLKLHRKYQI